MASDDEKTDILGGPPELLDDFICVLGEVDDWNAIEVMLIDNVGLELLWKVAR